MTPEIDFRRENGYAFTKLRNWGLEELDNNIKKEAQDTDFLSVSGLLFTYSRFVNLNSHLPMYLSSGGSIQSI